MNKQVVEYLKKERVGVLTTLIEGGQPHGATLHFSHKANPFELYFSTEKGSRKMGGLKSAKPVKASFVCGFSEKEWITLQMEGNVNVVAGKDLLAVHKVHYAKHPGSAKYKDDPGTVFLRFTPKWWRYTDYNTNPMTILHGKD